MVVDQADKVLTLNFYFYAFLLFASAPHQLFYWQDKFDHPYVSFLFYGMDAAGDFIPIKQLREKFNRPRYEVPLDPRDDSEDRKS